MRKNRFSIPFLLSLIVISNSASWGCNKLVQHYAAAAKHPKVIRQQNRLIDTAITHLDAHAIAPGLVNGPNNPLPLVWYRFPLDTKSKSGQVLSRWEWAKLVNHLDSLKKIELLAEVHGFYFHRKREIRILETAAAIDQTSATFLLTSNGRETLHSIYKALEENNATNRANAGYSGLIIGLSALAYIDVCATLFFDPRANVLGCAKKLPLWAWRGYYFGHAVFGKSNPVVLSEAIDKALVEAPTMHPSLWQQALKEHLIQRPLQKHEGLYLTFEQGYKGEIYQVHFLFRGKSEAFVMVTKNKKNGFTSR